MKTTLDLPDQLMKQIKVRAAKSGQKLKDLVAELLEKGLAAAQPSQPGLPYLECQGDALGATMTAAEVMALDQQTQFEEDLERLGVASR